MDWYDASAAPAPGPKEADLLLRMQAVDADQRLLALLDEVDEMVEAGRARDREEGVDPGIATLLDAISGDEKAPLEFRLIHQRVQEGKLTWEEFWVAPEEVAGGHRLLNTAMKAGGAQLAETLRAFDEDDEHDEQPPPGGGVLGR